MMSCCMAIFKDDQLLLSTEGKLSAEKRQPSQDLEEAMGRAVALPRWRYVWMFVGEYNPDLVR